MPKGKNSEPRRTKPGSDAESARASAKADSEPKPARRGRRKETLVPASSAAPLGPSQLEIAERAYQLYLDRGGSPGSDFEDWIRAERQLRDARGLK